VVVGAFGKHPAWNDHIDPDIGLDGVLQDVKRRLYLDGIRDHAIASWLNALPEQLIPFGHVFVWKRPDGLIAGRLWQSRDGRGRDDFPMVVCARCADGSLARAVADVLPALEQLEVQIRAATTREAVVSLVDVAQQSLLDDPSAPPAAGFPEGAAVRRLATCPELGGNGDGLPRVFHALRDVDPGHSGSRAEHVRVPRCSPSAPEAILDWARLLEARLGPVHQMLFLAPLAEGWLDVLVGKPEPSHFYTLRASLKLVPLTTDIAYTVNDRLMADTRAFVLGTTTS